jgi:hypothetical protein
MNSLRPTVFALSCTAIASPARAGMPSLHLTDIARLRVENISFFLVVLLLSALCVQLIWNWLRADFPRLPRLTYPKALAIIGLWGLLFVLVLTMIAGARELMTPGAWEKHGTTYRLKQPSAVGGN